MTTQERLEAITDRGMFEGLATSVLREADPECASIIHIGMNAAGETIVGPVDGFVRVPGSEPPRYVMLVHATTDRPGLPGKWLAVVDSGATRQAQSKSGDLVKAARLADRIREREPEARFRVVFTTNQRVDQPLVDRLDAAAARFRVGYEIWDQHRLAHFLDIHGDGQWIRRRYLGVLPQRGSLPLLVDVGARSVADYADRFVSGSQDLWVNRASSDVLRSWTVGGRAPLTLLVGPSGSGKSTLAYRWLTEARAPGAVALWVSAEDVARAGTLAEAIGLTIRRYEPEVEEGVGNTAIQLAGIASPLLIVVDDINRSPAPSTLLRKLMAWAKSLGTLAVSLICPVWDRIWKEERIGSPSGEKIAVVDVGLFGDDEAVEAVALACSGAGHALPQAECAVLAHELGRDPFAIGLFGRLLPDAQPSQFRALAMNALGEWVERALHSATPRGELPEDAWLALQRTGSAMLRERKLVPSWTDVREWIGPLTAPLVPLITSETLCRLEEPQTGGRFVFRHDRVRDYVLHHSLAEMFRQREVGTASDPFYTELAAAATARRVSGEVLAFLTEHAPLALLATLAHMRRLSVAEQSQVREAVRRWSRERGADFVQAFGVDRLVTELLLEADDEVALEVADLLPRSHWLDLARMANGDMAAALRSFNPSLNSGSGADVNHPVRERALARAAMRFPREIRSLIFEVLNTDNAEDDLAGAMVMAGFLREQSFCEPVLAAFRRTGEPNALLIHALWATSRCAGDERSAASVRQLIASWERVDDDPTDKLGRGTRSWIGFHLRMAFFHGISAPAVAEFIAASRGPLGEEIKSVLATVDDPAAIEMITRAAAASRVRAKATGSFSPWAITVADTWAAGWPNRRSLSTASRIRVETMWRSGTEDISVREQAFRLWARSADVPSLELMQTVRADDPLYETALWWRMFRADQSVTDAILPHFESKPHWLSYAGRIWNDRTRNIVDSRLAVAAAHLPRDFSAYGDSEEDLTTVLEEIPAADAAELLEKHWDGLRFGSLYVQTALQIGTRWCREAAYASILEAGEGSQLLDHMVLRLGMHRDGREYSAGITQLESLTPILDRLDDSSLSWLVGLAERIGARDWAIKNVRPHLSDEERLRQPLTEEDFAAALANEVEDSRWGVGYVAHWAEDQLERGWRSEVAAAARRYFLDSPTVPRFDVLARVLAVVGTRTDLPDLDDLARIVGTEEKLVRGLKLVIRRRTLE